MRIEDSFLQNPTENQIGRAEALLTELDGISHELAERHREEMEKGLESTEDADAFLGQCINKITAAIKFRKEKEAPKITYAFVEPENNPGIIEKNLFESVSFALKMREETYIYRGSTAAVFELPENPKVCAKIIDNHALYKKGNSVQVEAEFLEEIRKLRAGSVRAPRPLYILECADTAILVMEKLDGDNFQQLIDEKKEFQENFNLSTYFECLREFFTALHESGKIHGDIALRNFLIDRKTGLPFVVDFGRSVSLRELEREHSLTPALVEPKDKFKQLAEQEMKNLELVFNEAKTAIKQNTQA